MVCKAFYAAEGRVEKEEQRALTTVHNIALGLSSEGLVGVKWVTGGITEHYELWELIGLEPNEEVVVGPAPRTHSPGQGSPHSMSINSRLRRRRRAACICAAV